MSKNKNSGISDLIAGSPIRYGRGSLIFLLIFLSYFSIGNNEFEDAIVELDIDDAVELARHQSEAVLASKKAIESVKSSTRAEMAFAYPHLSLNGTYTRNEQLPSFPFGPFGEIESGRKNDYRGNLHAEQLIWNFRRSRAIRKQSDARISNSTANAAIISREIAYQTRLSILGLLLERARKKITQERISQRQDELDDARDLRDAGLVTELDSRQAEINLVRTNDLLRTVDSRISQFQFDIASQLAMGPDKFQIIGKLARPVELNEWISNVRLRIMQSAELVKLQSENKIQNTEKRSLKSERLPKLYLFADAGQEGDNLGDLSDSWGIGLRLSWDLYDGGDRMARKLSADNRIHEINLLQDEIIRNRRSAIAKIEIEIKSIDERITLEKQALELARANYSDAREQYRSGLITLTRLGETSLAVSETRFRHISLIHQEQITLAELIRLTE